MPVSLRTCACLLLGGLLFDGCGPAVEEESERVTGLRPVYATYAEMRTVQTLAPQPLRNPGKIYVKDQFLFVNEQGRGIHIIDNADPAQPRKLSFVAIPGNADVSVKDSILYANNGTDLVALNIRNPRQVRLVRRLEGVLPYPSYPAEQNVRFECADPEKGIVVRWEPAELTNPKCRR